MPPGRQNTAALHPTSMAVKCLQEGRFVYTARMLKEYHPQVHGPIVDFALEVLGNVTQSSTKWSIVYDKKD